MSTMRLRVAFSAAARQVRTKRWLSRQVRARGYARSCSIPCVTTSLSDKASAFRADGLCGWHVKGYAAARLGQVRTMCSVAPSGSIDKPDDVTVADCQDILKEHGPRTLAHEMLRHVKHTMVQNEAFGALLEHVRDDASVQEELANAGMVDAIVQGMLHHLFTGSVQRSGAVLLFNLTFHERAAVLRAGGIKALVPILSHHAEDLDSQAVACRALCRLADPDTIPEMVVAGVGAGLVKTMKVNDFDCAIQEAACALAAMVARHEASVASLVADGLVPSVVTAIAGPYGTMADHERVLMVGIVALIQLAWRSSEAARVLCEERGLDVVADVMRVVPDNADVADRASHLAWIVCSHPGGPDAVVATGLLQRLVDALNRHPESAALTGRACSVFAELSERDSLLGSLKETGAVAACQAAAEAANAGYLNPHGEAIVAATNRVLKACADLQ